MYDQGVNNEKLRTNLDLLTKRHEKVAIKEAKYKEEMARYYNWRVHHTQFWVDDEVLKNNKSSKAKSSDKLEANWEGLYKITEVFPKGNYKYTNGKRLPRTWYVINLKRYYI